MQIIKELMYKLSTTAAIVWGIFSYVAFLFYYYLYTINCMC